MTSLKTPKQLHLDVKLDEKISLDNFINCSSTNTLLGILRNIPDKSAVSNFHYLWGSRGVGKSYLMHALNRECLSRGLTTAFISFSDERINSPEVLNDLSQMNVLFLEDFNNMQAGNEWESEVFNLINECVVNQNQIIISSNKIAKNLDIKLKDLQSRLIGFVGLEVPEVPEEDKIKALLESAERKGIALEDKTLKYILTYTSRNLSDLLRLLSELDEFSLEKKKKLSPSLVRELLSQKSNSLHI